MARNCNLRCAANSQYLNEERELTPGGVYLASSKSLLTSTNSSWRKGLTRRHFREPAFSISEQKRPSYSLFVTALIASALGGGVLAFNLVSLEELYPRSANGANALSLSMLNPTQVQYVEIAPLAPVDVRNYGPRRKNAQPSHELGSSSVHHRLNGENLVATPVPAYLIETPSGSPPSREAFARKSEPAHEYWRPTIGASSVIERYQLYPHSHPSGVVADTAVDRIKESEQATEKATSTKISQRVPKSEKSQSTSKNTQPAVEQNVALSVKEANAVQCRDQNDSKCREPLKTLSKNCSIGTGLTPEGVCLRKNYRASTVIKR